PTPGSLRSAVVRASREAGPRTDIDGRCSERHLESRGQRQPLGEAGHLLLGRLLGLAQPVVHRGDDEILEHVAVVLEQARVDLDAAHLVAAAHGHLHHARAGLALDVDLRELFLRPAHVLLHLLRLLHQAGQLTFHHVLSPVWRVSSGRTEPGTMAPLKSSISVRTNGSASREACAVARRCSSRSRAMATAVGPSTFPVSTLSRPSPRTYSAGAARPRATVPAAASARIGTLTVKSRPLAATSSLWCMNSRAMPVTGSRRASAGQSPSKVAGALPGRVSPPPASSKSGGGSGPIAGSATATAGAGRAGATGAAPDRAGGVGARAAGADGAAADAGGGAARAGVVGT